MRTLITGAAILFLLASPAVAAEDNGPVVLELFTSQGCSSCPAADALLKDLAASDSSVIALSFHIHYWDRLGWKDTYSSPDNTARQNAYVQALHLNNMFIPQILVNGSVSAVGSHPQEVKAAINKAMQTPFTAGVSIAPAGENGQLTVSIRSKLPTKNTVPLQVWDIRFDAHANTQIEAGENRGRTLESINNVTSITSLGNWQTDKEQTFALANLSGGGVAVLVQEANEGPIAGAAAYVK